MFTDLNFILAAFSGRSIRFLVCIACLLSIVAAQDDGPKTARPSLGANDPSMPVSVEPLVFGTVEAQDGQPVFGAKVWLVVGGPEASEVLGETTTDIDGKFAFDELADEETVFRNPGMIGVWSQHPTEGLGWFSGFYNHKRKPLSIRLSPTAKFTGQLAGTDGQPLAGVRITPRSLATTRLDQNGPRDGQLFHEMSQRLSTTTTDDGSFEIEDLPGDGGVTCDVAAPGFHDLRVSWNLNKPFVIGLDPGVSFSGRVTWPEEVSIPTEQDFRFGTVKLTAYSQFQADGTISSEDKNAVYGTQNTYSVEIDSEGQFRLDHLAPGRYYISAEFSPRLPLLLSASEQLEIKSARIVDDFELVTEKAFKVSGRVVGFETKKPVANAIVQIFRRVPGGLVPSHTITTDENGEYFAFTKEGKHTLRVAESPPEFVPAANSYDSEFAKSRNPTIDVTGDTVFPDLELDTACDVTLEVFDEHGKPAAGAIVKIAAVAGFPAGENYQTEQRTDAEGKYIARRVTVNDTLPICVRTPTAISDPDLVITSGEVKGPVRIDLSPDHGFRCRCRVVDPEGEPIANAIVSVETYYFYISKWSAVERGSAISGIAGGGVTDPNGYFETGPLWPDRDYRLTVEAVGHDLAETPRVKGKAGEVVELKPVVLSAAKAAKIVGVVVDSEKRPVEGVRVFAAGNTYVLATTQTNAAGEFELNEVAADVRYVFADGGADFRLGGTRLGNQQPLEIAIRSVDSPTLGIRENRMLSRDEQLTVANDLIEQVWSLPAGIGISSQYELLRAMVQIDPARAMEKALALGRGLESHVLAEQAFRAVDDDPERALQFLLNARTRSGILTAIALGKRLAKSDNDQDKQTATGFAELALNLMGGSTVFHFQLAKLYSLLGQHDKAQALIAKVLEPIDLENIAEEQKSTLIFLATAMAPYDFEQAWSFASLEKEGASRTYALADVVVALVATDHEKAIREIDSLTGDSNAPNIRDIARYRVACLLFATHPDIALRLVNQCEQAGNRAQALGRLAVQVAEFDQPQAWRMIDSALAIHRDHSSLYSGWSGSGGAGTFAAALAWQAQQVRYPDMESVIWHVLASCRANAYRGQDRLGVTVKTARILALVDKIAARDLLNAVADKTGQLSRNEGTDSLYEQWLQAWLLVDFGRGTRLLSDELDELKNGDVKNGPSYGHASAFRLLVAPQEERYKLLLRETGLWKLEEDDTMENR